MSLKSEAWLRPDCVPIAYRLPTDCVPIAIRLPSNCVPTAFREVRRAVLPLPCTEQVGMGPILIFFVLLADYQPVIANFYD